MPGKNFIKVTSILFIVSAVFSIIVYTLAGLLFGAATLDTGESAGLLFIIVCLLYTVLSVLQLIAGVKGVKGCNSKSASAGLIKWGKMLLILALLAGIINFIQSVLGGTSVFSALISVLCGLVLPGLYIHGAALNEKA